MIAIAPTDQPLYALAPQYKALIEQMLDVGGDLSDEQLAAEFNAIEEAFDAKTERCQMLYRALMAEADAAEAFCKPWKERAELRRRAAERLKSYVFGCMTQAGLKKIETPLGGARIQASPASAKCAVEGEAIPEAYRRTVYSFNAKQAIEDFKAGKMLPEGVSIEQSQHLRWI